MGDSAFVRILTQKPGGKNRNEFVLSRKPTAWLAPSIYAGRLQTRASHHTIWIILKVKRGMDR
jgi:hypothetical protein